MKWVIYFLAQCFILVSCSTQDEPNFNQEPVSDWHVLFMEVNIPTSEKITNTSKECLDWKETHKEYCRTIQTTDEIKQYIWNVTYNNCTETQVISAVDEFINFTIWPYDRYEATVAYNGYYVIHSYRKGDEDNISNKWKVTFYEQRSNIVNNNFNYTEYEKWANEHKQFLIYESKNKNIWEMELDVLTQQNIDELIVPFVKMSYGQYNDSSYVGFSVTVYQYNSSKEMYYVSRIY